jgi:hypothetical protein
VHTDLECDLGIISSGEAMIPMYKSSDSTVTSNDTFSADGDVNTTSAETNTESNDTSAMSDDTFGAVVDVNTTSAKTNTESDDNSEKSKDEATSPGTRILKHQMVTFALMLPFFF